MQTIGSGIARQLRCPDRPGREIRRRHGVRRELRACHRAIGEFRRGHRAIGYIGRHHGVADGGNALVRGQLLETVGPVVEPDAQPDVGIGENTGGNRRHVGERGVAQQDGVDTLSNRQSHSIARLAASRAGAVIAPERGAAVAVDKRELEFPGAVEVHAIHSHATLEIDELRHLRVERRAELDTEGDK